MTNEDLGNNDETAASAWHFPFCGRRQLCRGNFSLKAPRTGRKLICSASGLRMKSGGFAELAKEKGTKGGGGRVDLLK